MQKAVQELYAKHKRANAAVYGDLGYLILLNFATAADAVSDFALNLLAQTWLSTVTARATDTTVILYVVNHAVNTSTQRVFNIAYNEALHSGVVKN